MYFTLNPNPMTNKPSIHLKKTSDASRFTLSIFGHMEGFRPPSGPADLVTGTSMTITFETDAKVKGAWIHWETLLQKSESDTKFEVIFQDDQPDPTANILGKAKVRYEDAEDPEILIPTN